MHRGLDILTNKSQSSITHLQDFYSPLEPVHANRYAKTARKLIRQINDRNKVAIVEGGSTFYLRMLLEQNVDQYADEELMTQCKELVAAKMSKERESNRNPKMFQWLHEMGAQLKLDKEHQFLAVSDNDEYRLETRLS